VHIVILGCGRVGSALAHTLDRQGHSVSIVDQLPEAFRKLHPEFGGNTIVGIGFDRDTLIDAGIARAQAFAACSSGDNTNIIAARVARETFGVTNVVARIYDPRRAEVYQRLGIPTVDVGMPMLSMHSARELMAISDVPTMVDAFAAWLTA